MTVGGPTPTGADARPDPGRWELLRALGAYSAAPAAGVSTAIGLPTLTVAEHTEVFVLDLPPHASIHLGAEGKLGGEGAERVAGLWRALGVSPPSDPDHLARLLALVAELGEGREACRTEGARERLAHVLRVLLGEHLVSWLPGYLIAAARYPAVAPWAELTRAALRREVQDLRPPDVLAAALREAPPALDAAAGAEGMLDAVVAPLRCGFVLTHRDLRQAGADTGSGVRRGERRYVLSALLGQEPAATIEWLAGHARRWSGWQAVGVGSDATARWWSQRASRCAATLEATRSTAVAR